MARVKRAVNAAKKRRVILERAEGYRGQRSRLYRKAKEQVTHSLVYSYRDRRAKKGDFRRLWIQRINAASRANGLTYNRLIQGSTWPASRWTVASSPNSPSTSRRRSRRWSRRQRRHFLRTRLRRRRCRNPSTNWRVLVPKLAPKCRMIDNPRSPRVRGVAKLAKGEPGQRPAVPSGGAAGCR